jgi:hypothetical protein
MSFHLAPRLLVDAGEMRMAATGYLATAIPTCAWALPGLFSGSENAVGIPCSEFFPTTFYTFMLGDVESNFGVIISHTYLVGIFRVGKPFYIVLYFSMSFCGMLLLSSGAEFECTQTT